MPAAAAAADAPPAGGGRIILLVNRARAYHRLAIIRDRTSPYRRRPRVFGTREAALEWLGGRRCRINRNRWMPVVTTKEGAAI